MDADRRAAALQGGYEVRIGAWIGRGGELFGERWGPYVLFTLINIAIGALGRGLIQLVIGGHLAAGFYVFALRQARGQPADFGDFWRAFQAFLPFFLLGILTKLLTGIGLVLCILPGIYLAVSYMLVYPILWDTGMDFWDAMELSRKVVTAHWFSWFAFALLIVAMNIAGVLLCGVGLLATIPISYCAVAAAYEEVLGRPAGSAVSPAAPAP
jgi:uncharacterized membrane protein